MRTSKIIFFLFVLMTINGFGQQPPKSLSGKLIIFHAGSLAVPMKEISTAFRKINPDVEIFLESAGSVECARKITDLKKPCDIMASSDYSVIEKMLIPDYAEWNLPFVTNEMCIVFSEKSKYSKSISSRNWIDILSRKEVIIGRSDPNSDPCGYRSVMVMQLAEKFYKKPGLANTLTGKDVNYVRPKEVDLVALLESNSIDYAFLYKSVAIQHQFKYIELPEEINLKNPKNAELYSSAQVQINGKEPGSKTTVKGEPMLYALTILKNAVNKEVAVAFVDFMLDPAKGMAILQKNGQPSVIPQKNSRYGKLPAPLQKYVLAIM